MNLIATTPSVNQVSTRYARIIPSSTSIPLKIKTIMKLISSRKSTRKMATLRHGQTGQSSITVTITGTTKAMPHMAIRRIIHS